MNVALAISILLSFLVGCAADHKGPRGNQQSVTFLVSEDAAEYPRETEDGGLIFEPVYVGNTTLDQWAKNRAHVYGAEVKYIYSTKYCYHAVLRKDNAYLLVWEMRVRDFTKTIEGQRYWPGLNLKLFELDLLDGELEPQVLGENSHPIYDETVEFWSVPQRLDDPVNEDHLDWDLPIYDTEHIKDNGEKIIWGDTPPWVISDDNLNGKPIMFVWMLNYRSEDHKLILSELESVYWLTPE